MTDSRSPFAPLRHPTYRSMWIASMASNLGGLVQAVGAAWMMTALTTSENLVALVQASTALPIMLFSVVSGALADSFDRRRVMLTAQFLMLAASLLLTTVAALDLLTPWLLLMFTFVIGSGTALHNPSWQASVGDIVPRPDLPEAVSLNSAGFNITRSVGPALGGVIVAVAGAAAAFAVNAVSYFALIYALLRWRPEVPNNPLPREALGSAISAGFRYVAMSPNLEKVMLRGFVFGLSAGSVLALLPVVARDILDGGALTYGIMFGAFGVGGIAGAFLNAHIRQRLRSEAIVRVSFTGFAISAAIIGLSGSSAITFVALVLAGICWVVTLSLLNTVVQLSTPRWVVGRALSLYQTATFGGIAAGSWLWGQWAEDLGPANALVSSSLLMLAGAALGLRLPMPDFRSLNLDPLNRFVEPSLSLEIQPRSGPIVIQVDYDIADEDLPEFLSLMAERRRIRIRDGARNWALMRDLQYPEIWTETYHVPTWVEYVRHNQRRTQADAETTDRILALHRGEQVRVHRMIERQAIPSTTNDVFHQPHIDPH
ncbi:MFS transporter [Pseudorhizobium sp. NPDC055634]